MPVPTWTAGQVLTAADVDTWFVPIVALKTSNESVTSSTAQQNDNELFAAVAANAVYWVDALIIYDGATAGDIDISWTAPAGATMDWVSMGLGLATTASTDTTSHTAQTVGTTGLIGALGAGTSLVIPARGVLHTAGTAGNLQLQWAQDASSGTATRVLAGSALVLRRIG